VLSTTPLRWLVRAFLFIAAGLGSTAAAAEDGYDLWLRYRPLKPAFRQQYASHATAIVLERRSPTMLAAAGELQRGLGELLGRAVSGSAIRNGAIVLTSATCSPTGAYTLRSGHRRGRPVTIISGCGDVGTLHGAFAFLRLIQTHSSITNLAVADSPKLPLRMLDHWDNLDGTVERGFAGPSLWDWRQLPRIDPRMIDYARANASIGINAVVLNNVNADARIFTPEYLRKVAALGDAWRPYGIRIFLSARFSAPIELGRLKTADPLDRNVQAWWQAKTVEIYRLIPDFGGFLVKANSEGQPGPQTYRRTHADGANMLAAALAPHGGTLLWRAFVYSGSKTADRAMQAYDEFVPLDGKFALNVIVQVKNGPIDFQPREPFHPLFGAMPRTRLAMEVQVTREYLGENAGIVWLGTMWSEALRSRTARPHSQSRVLDSLTAMAGVANTGSDRNWSGSDFDQANWYAFGRLAWNPAAQPERIADDWARMTWGNDPRVVKPIVAMMLDSRQAMVDSMTPLGLAHQMATGHHYGPGPWVANLPELMWNPAYYNRVDAEGIGFDRTATGSNAVAQYAPEIAACFADLRCVRDDDLLWFHHVPWTYRLHSGRTVWDELVIRYDRGVARIDAMNRAWSRLAPLMDSQRHAAVAQSLRRQLLEAYWWRDASIAYFQSLSKLPLPPGHPSPAHPLSWYEAVHFDTVPGFLIPRIGTCRSSVVVRGDPPCVP
jgi:alpha-glucuronidase